MSSSPSKENAFTGVPALVPTVSTTSCERWLALPLLHETDVDVDQAVVEQMLLPSCAETERTGGQSSGPEQCQQHSRRWPNSHLQPRCWVLQNIRSHSLGFDIKMKQADLS